MSRHSNITYNPEFNSNCSLNTKRWPMQNMRSTPEEYSEWLRELTLNSPNPIRSSVPDFQQPGQFPLPINQTVPIPSGLNKNYLESRLRNDSKHNFTLNALCQFVEQHEDSLDDLITTNKKSEETDTASNGSTSGFSEDSNIFRSPRATNYSRGHFNRRQHQQEKACFNSNSIQQKKNMEFIRLAMHGANQAEEIGKHYQRCPFFSTIDTLCGRMKQNLLENNKIVGNMRSQGIPWAMKEFIFVFARVIESWIKIKGYVYNTSPGLDTIKSAYSPEFFKSFLEWQNCTALFIDNLIKSFVNVHNLVESQEPHFQKWENCPPPKKSFDSASLFKDRIFESNNPLVDEAPKRPIIASRMRSPLTGVCDFDSSPIDMVYKTPINHTYRSHHPLTESNNQHTSAGFSSQPINYYSNWDDSVNGKNNLKINHNRSESYISRPISRDCTGAPMMEQKQRDNNQG